MQAIAAMGWGRGWGVGWGGGVLATQFERMKKDPYWHILRVQFGIKSRSLVEHRQLTPGGRQNTVGNLPSKATDFYLFT